MLNEDNDGASYTDGMWGLNEIINTKYFVRTSTLDSARPRVSIPYTWTLLSSYCTHMTTGTQKFGWVKSVSGDPVPRKPEEVIRVTLETKQAVIQCILSQVTSLSSILSSLLTDLLQCFSELEVKLWVTRPPHLALDMCDLNWKLTEDRSSWRCTPCISGPNLLPRSPFL